MVRRLQLGKYVGYILLAMVALAIWQGFNGNVSAMADKAWELLQDGANVVTHIWNSVSKDNKGGKGSK